MRLPRKCQHLALVHAGLIGRRPRDYAVATNSIGSAEIRNNSIRAKDIRDGQVSSADSVRGGAEGWDGSEPLRPVEN
jgi:hypothetical protein